MVPGDADVELAACPDVAAARQAVLELQLLVLVVELL